MNARCTCACLDHAQFRVAQYGTHATTTTTSAPSVTRTVLFGTDMRISKVYENGVSHPYAIQEGDLRVELDEEGPTEAEIERAIESIKRAMPDG